MYTGGVKGAIAFQKRAGKHSAIATGAVANRLLQIIEALLRGSNQKSEKDDTENNPILPNIPLVLGQISLLNHIILRYK